MSMDTTQRDALERSIACRLLPLSHDELRVIDWVLAGLEEGVALYGRWEARLDKRDHKTEKIKELRDAITYALMDAIIEHDKAARVKEFVEAIDDEPTGKYVIPETIITDPDSGGVPTTWMAELGEPKIEIAVARTDSSEFPVMGMTACDDCAAPAGALHRSGCPYTVIVPASEVA